MKIIKILSVLMAILILVLSMTACKDSGFPVTVGGAEITEPPQTVAVISEQAASAICALGYKDYLVAAPSEFLTTKMEGVTDLGSTMFIDYEKVYELSPNVLITPGELTSSVLENLKMRNINVVVLKNPSKYSEVAPYYEALSKLFLGENKYTEAYDAYIGETKRIISETKTSLQGVNKKVALFVEEGFIATGDTLAGEALEKAGFINIGSEKTDYMMSAEEIKNANPDVIFCPEGLSEIIMGMKVYKDVTAIKNGAVYEVDASALVFASEGFAATIQSMSKYLLQ